ncbi:class F sortase [Micrococcus lylae]|uniref:class F sortase n=1 Tax=Micrococcus lylae TaxID=1273 RepID=UPI0021A527F1|nr:class F sortase [Micrococcus lylae]MCT2007774.1 class F sortase [Micrococcus lylae]MCT2072408.1 class F sortase [Micrococcus lylae]
MHRNVKRAIWVVALLACLAVVWFSVRGLFAFGEVPISQAPTAAPLPSVSSPASGTASPSVSSSGAPPSSNAPSSSGVPSSASATPTREAGAPSATQSPASSEAASSEASGPASSEASTPAAPTSSEAASPESSAPASTSAEPEPSPSPTPTPTGPPAAPMDEITAAPVHVDVYHEGEQYIGAPIVPEHRDEDGELNPEPRNVGWYAPPQWSTTPGELSSHPGILTGHVIHSGLKDVFYRLEETRKGDLVVVTYEDGTQATFTLDTDPVQMGKRDLIDSPEFAWAWELEEPGRKVTLITCELVPGSGMTGHSVDNWVVQATRIS